MLKSVARFAFARGLPGVINFAALALFTRLLDEQGYGSYALVIAGASLAYALSLQWLGHGALRLAAPYAEHRPVFLGTLARLFVPLSLAAAGVVGIGIGLSVGWREPGLILAGAAFLVSQGWHELNLSLVTADQRPVSYAVLGAVRALAGLTLGALAAGAGWGAAGVVAGYVSGNLLAGAVAYQLCWRPYGIAGADARIRRELLQYGLPLVGAFLLAYVVSAADRFLLAALISPAAAGIYAPSYDLAVQLIATLMMVINLAVFPMAVAAVEGDDSTVRGRVFRHHITILVGVALPAAAGIAVLAPALSGILGPRFAPSARLLLPILAMAQLCSGIKAFYLDLSFQLGKNTRLQLATAALGAVVNVALNLWWIPRYGILGSAYATLAAYLVAMLASWWLGRGVLRLPIPSGPIARVLLATAGMCAALAPIRESTGIPALLGQVALGAAVYAVLLVALSRGDPRRLLPA